MLRHSYDQGIHTAFLKFALAPPTQVDEFVAGVENGKDVPLDPSTDAMPMDGVSESADAMPMPEDPAMAQGLPPAGMPMGLGEMAAKAAAFGPKDMAFYRNTLGDEAGSAFLAKHDMRTHTGIPQDFSRTAPVATSRPAAPAATPGPSSKVVVSPSLKTSVRPR